MNSIEIDTEISPARIVKNDIRAAAVFERYGIDFCCKGKEPLAKLCEEKSIDVGTLTEELSRLDAAPPALDFGSMKAYQLIGYIIEHHHSYVRRAIPIIQQHIHKVAERHGTEYPENGVIARMFDALAEELTEHLHKEEHVLFPYIQHVEMSCDFGLAPTQSHFGTALQPIAAMEREHEVVGEAMQCIRELSHNFTPPPAACNTYKAAYAELREFEEDLHKHIHLENNILHPMALELEEKQWRNSPQTATNLSTY